MTTLHARSRADGRNARQPRTEIDRGVQRAHRRARGDPRRVRARRRNRFADDLDVVEGFRYVTRCCPSHRDSFVEGDPERPRFSSIVGAGAQAPRRQPRLDLPPGRSSAATARTACRGVGARRSTSRSRSTAADPTGGFDGRVLADINDRRLRRSTPTARFELVFSADRAPDGNWVRLDPDARMVHRAQLLPARAVGPERSRRSRSSIEHRTVGRRRPPLPLDDATLAARLRAGDDVPPRADARPARVRHAVDGAVRGRRTEPRSAQPWSFRNAGVDVAGAVDIFYSSGTSTSARRRTRDGRHHPACRLHQRDVLERAHADARVPITGAR